MILSNYFISYLSFYTKIVLILSDFPFTNKFVENKKEMISKLKLKFYKIWMNIIPGYCEYAGI